MRNSTAAVVPRLSVATPDRHCAGWARCVWNLPRNILILLLMAYRKVVSPLYGQVCRFFPSCSAYALEAITVHGAVKGSWLAARRLLRCHPMECRRCGPCPRRRTGNGRPTAPPQLLC